MQRYVRLDKQGGVAVCLLTADGEVVTARIPAHGQPLFRGPWLSGDGRFVLVASGAASDGNPATAFRVWRLDRPEPELVLDESVGTSVLTVAFRPGSQQLAVAHADRSVSIFDLTTGQRLRRLALDNTPYHMEYHPQEHDGRLAIAAGSAVRIFDATTGQEHKPLRHSPGSSWASGLAWHPDGRRIATSCDTQIFLWDAATATPLTLPWEGHTTQGIHLAFNHAGDRVVSTDWGGETRLWDAVTGRLLLRSPGYVGLRFSRDDKLLGYGHSGNKVRLYRVAPGRELRAVRHLLAGPKDQVGSPVLDSDGRILAMGEENLQNDACQSRRDILLGFAERRRLGFQNRAHGVGSSVAVKGTFAGNHFVQDCAQAENVGTRIGWLSSNLFGRHIADRAQNQAGLGLQGQRGVSAPEESFPGPASLAKPKSRILMRPSLVRKTFSGLRSR